MALTLERYTKQVLPAWEFAMLRDCPAPFADQIVWPWFNDIAPVKAEKYGMEAWLTLGVRALVVETNGGFFRWKRMMEIDIDREDENYLDTIRDVFGYSIMMGVLLYDLPASFDSFNGDLYERWPMRNARWYNDTLINEVWKYGIETNAFWWAFRMSQCMFKEGGG